MPQPASIDRAQRRQFASTAHQTAGQVAVLREAKHCIHAGMTGAQARAALDTMIADLQTRIDGGRFTMIGSRPVENPDA